MATFSTSEILVLEDIRTKVDSIRDEYARKRKQRDKPRPSAYMNRDD
jgi:hypothetical protein